jgi:hypothetical protein
MPVSRSSFSISYFFFRSLRVDRFAFLLPAFLAAFNRLRRGVIVIGPPKLRYQALHG